MGRRREGVIRTQSGDGATEMGFLKVLRNKYAEVTSPKKTRQNLGHAGAWASFAPMPLHRPNRHGGMSKLTKLAPSEARGGGEVMDKIGR
jgi:hypothetical protein